MALTELKKKMKQNKTIITLAEPYFYIRNQIYTAKKKKYANKQELVALKDTKKGKRCFIVGNGPSLNIDDLEKIKQEDSFAVNRIYQIFNQTSWRPTYYCSQDLKVLEEIQQDMNIVLDSCDKVFLNSEIALISGVENINPEKLCYFYLDLETRYPQMPNFSEKIEDCIYEGFTVAYACIQLAVYMGYSEIYIIGTDHNYNINLSQEGKIQEHKDVVNYMKGLEGKLGYPPQLERSALAFRKARCVCESRGIIIKNATRGGKLEEFERVCFEDLLNPMQKGKEEGNGIQQKP